MAKLRAVLLAAVSAAAGPRSKRPMSWKRPPAAAVPLRPACAAAAAVPLCRP